MANVVRLGAQLDERCDAVVHESQTVRFTRGYLLRRDNASWNRDGERKTQRKNEPCVSQGSLVDRIPHERPSEAFARREDDCREQVEVYGGNTKLLRSELSRHESVDEEG